MVEKNGYKGYGFDVLLNIGADRMDITPPTGRPKTALLGISQLAEPLSRLHLSPSKAI